jgi:hypothetical protein
MYQKASPAMDYFKRGCRIGWWSWTQSIKRAAVSAIRFDFEKVTGNPPTDFAQFVGDSGRKISSSLAAGVIQETNLKCFDTPSCSRTQRISSPQKKFWPTSLLGYCAGSTSVFVQSRATMR